MVKKTCGESPMKTEIQKLTKSEVALKITIPHQRVGEEFEKVLAEAAKEIEIEGFRKGHAPKSVVREKVDKPATYGKVANRLVTTAYNEAVKQHFLKPVVGPKIEVLQFEPESGKDLIFKATTAERPEVTLGNYKKPPDTPTVLQAVLKTAKVEIPKLLIEDEVNRMLSRLVDQTGRLGLTVEQYLQSQGKTAERLRAEYAKQAEENLKAELVLDEIAKVEKIEITDKEIADAVKAAPDDASRQELEKEENKWYIKSVLRQKKTLQRLEDIAKNV